MGHSDPLGIQRQDQVVVLENRDAPRNRMTFEYVDALEAALIAIRRDRTVDRARALDRILRARKIDGPTVLAIGMVHGLHPVAELKQWVLELAGAVAAQPPIAGAGVRRCGESADQVEVMAAFVEKRRRVFTGR